MNKLKLFIIFCLAVALSLFGYVFFRGESDDNDVSNQQQISPESKAPEEQPIKYKTLTGNEYKTLFLNSSHPNTKVILEPPEITGDKRLDDRIVELATKRGYELQQVPSTQLNKHDKYYMQEKMAEAWSSLKEQAAEAGIKLEISSAYRTVEEQREIFLQRLGNATADADINRVLELTAPPGYSRHHSGYVLDIADQDASVFDYSEAYKWISKDNYLAVKKLGIIPSYPEGAENQGPRPESWEYVWVGQQLLQE